jgi:hypothetical protein
MTNEAIHAALEIEYQIVYGYGIVGAHLRGHEQAFAADRLAAHQLLRDALLALDIADPQPPSARPAYRLPFPVNDATSARALAIRLEDAAAGAAWDLVATGRPRSRLRQAAVTALADVATAAARWRADAGATDDPALPGAAPPVTPQAASQPSMTPTTSPSPTTTASGSTS